MTDDDLVEQAFRDCIPLETRVYRLTRTIRLSHRLPGPKEQPQ